MISYIMTGYLYSVHSQTNNDIMIYNLIENRKQYSSLKTLIIFNLEPYISHFVKI